MQNDKILYKLFYVWRWESIGWIEALKILKFYNQLKILKVLWTLLTAEYVDVPTVFYMYYAQGDYMYLCSLFMLIQRLIYIALILSPAFSINSACFIVGQ